MDYPLSYQRSSWITCFFSTTWQALSVYVSRAVPHAERMGPMDNPLSYQRSAWITWFFSTTWQALSVYVSRAVPYAERMGPMDYPVSCQRSAWITWVFTTTWQALCVHVFLTLLVLDFMLSVWDQWITLNHIRDSLGHLYFSLPNEKPYLCTCVHASCFFDCCSLCMCFYLYVDVWIFGKGGGGVITSVL